MIEGLDTSMFNQSSGIGDDSTGCATDVRVDFKDLFDGFWDDEGGLESAFDCQDDSFCGLDADGR